MLRRSRVRFLRTLTYGLVALLLSVAGVSARQSPNPQTPDPASQGADDDAHVFDMGRIVVVGTPDGQPVVGGAVLAGRCR
jgi:hypothetical protein